MHSHIDKNKFDALYFKQHVLGDERGSLAAPIEVLHGQIAGLFAPISRVMPTLLADHSSEAPRLQSRR
ncbi:hypothetical protein [Burkholderia cepacia]|uniref:hypothetical protein n=1 Tax=Burkholderia cepacia TaxID=292 RepID=UPI0012D4811F|nr:hypothetical protein [Burkholderia cepacia]